MGGRVSIKTVASEAGVSVTTASYVLTNSDQARISAETAERVRQAAKKLHYIPSLSARTLINNRSNLLGIVIPRMDLGRELMFSNPFYGLFLSAVEYTARQHDYHMLLSGPKFDQKYADIAATRQLDGVIAVGVLPGELFDDIRRISIPTSLVDCYADPCGMHSIGIDDRHGGYLATRYLVDKGHRSIAFVGGQLHEHGVMEARYLGYQDALHEAGLQPDGEGPYIAEQVDYHAGYRLAPFIARRRGTITAAFVAADIIAVGLLNGALDQGLRVPEDLSLVGFDNLSMSYMCRPQLTTVSQDVMKKGEMATRVVLEEIMKKNTERQSILLPVEMVERGSVLDLNAQ